MRRPVIIIGGRQTGKGRQYIRYLVIFVFIAPVKSASMFPKIPKRKYRGV